MSAAKNGLHLTNFIEPGNQKTYDKDTLASLVESCTRLFCCDEEIVIADYLLHKEKAICEKDLEGELGISERRLREFLARLERNGLVARVNVGSQVDIYKKQHRVFRKEPPATSQSFWRLSNHFIIVVHYKLRKMEEIIRERLSNLKGSDNFICPSCKTVYDALDVQKLDIDGFDAHFICTCGSKVELDDKSARENIYISQERRFLDQVNVLKSCLMSAWGMEIPVFPIQSRKSDTAKETEKSETDSLVEASDKAKDNASVVSASSAASKGSSMFSKPNAAKSFLSDPGTNKRTELTRIKFHVKKSSQSNLKTVDRRTERVEAVRSDHGGGEGSLVDGESRVSGLSNSQESVRGRESDTIPTFFISALNKRVSLAEAQNLQKSMNNVEFEKFVELQDAYLNII